jgi:hypothetical protein
MRKIQDGETIPRATIHNTGTVPGILMVGLLENPEYFILSKTYILRGIKFGTALFNISRGKFSIVFVPLRFIIHQNEGRTYISI